MGHFIDLLDGTRIEVKFNFGTLYYLTQNGGDKMMARIQNKQEKNIEISDAEKIRFTARIIYALLRSNGLKVTEDEAMQLMPTDIDEIQKVMEVFEEELEKHKKKEVAKTNMKMMIANH